MSWLDRFQPKWKHADPAVRAEAMRSLKDDRQLGEIAAKDSSEEVRLAAIAALDDQAVLERVAADDVESAGAAAAKVHEQPALARLAQLAPRTEARQRAIERLADRNLLLRIAALDPVAPLRALARARAGGDDRAYHYLREMISKLPVADGTQPDNVEFSGTLEHVCQTLTQDARFFINGEVTDEASGEVAAVTNPTQAPWTVQSSAQGRATIRFLAQSRQPSTGNPASIEVGSFFNVKVWRLGEDRYEGVAMRKVISKSSDPFTWSHASGGAPVAERS